MYYIPGACWAGETGDTEERTNVESFSVGQWTRRLRLPNASRPNQRVLELSCNRKGKKHYHQWPHKESKHTTLKLDTRKLTTRSYLPIDDSPWSFNCTQNICNRTFPTFNTVTGQTRTTWATTFKCLHQKLGIVAITSKFKSSKNLT